MHFKGLEVVVALFEAVDSIGGSVVCPCMCEWEVVDCDFISPPNVFVVSPEVEGSVEIDEGPLLTNADEVCVDELGLPPIGLMVSVMT